MTNAQLFSYPAVNLKLDRDSIAPNAIPHVKARQIKITWTSLLGLGNRELATNALISSAKFAAFIDKTKGEFAKNYKDFNKFPKMNENDWK